jgi:SAM-dependent methyltransferase
MTDRSLETRHDVERHFHDHKAKSRPDSDPHDFYAAGGLDEVWRAYLARVGPLEGKTILDFGCGEGWAATEYARRGAAVHSFDISVESVRKLAGTRIHPAVMAAEQLGYHADSFDLVLGVGILHHTEVSLVSREVARVLRPGGRALFMEPLAHNPLLRVFRALTPGRRTPTERPMTFEQIREFTRGFGWADLRGYQLVSIIPQGLLWATGNRALFRMSLRLSEAMDRWLLPRLPPLQRYCWSSIIEVRK